MKSDRVTREEISQGGVTSAISSGSGGAVTTTMEKTSTGDSFFIPLVNFFNILKRASNEECAQLDFGLGTANF